MPSRLAFVIAVLALPTASFAQLNVIMSGGFASAYQEILPEFEKTSGVTVTTVRGRSQGNGPNAIGAQLRRGVPADVVIMSREGLDQLIAGGRIVAGSDVDLARTPLGLSVRAGAPKPDISTVDAFKRLLLRAKIITFPDSTTGIYMTTTLFPRLGVASEIAGKITHSGVAAVATGDAEIAIQPVSELLHVAGTDFVGTLPTEIQYVSVFSAAMVAASKEPESGKRLIAFLTSESALRAIEKSGMEIASGRTSSNQAPVKPAADPHSLVLAGDRFKPLKYDEMTPEQKTMIDHLLAGERQGARGPFNVLLRSPEVGDLAQQFGGSMRFHTALPKDVSETIIIMTGRFWMAQYEWTAHKAAALQNGVKPAIVDAIATGKRPTEMSPEMEVAYNFIDELLTTHQVTDATFKAAKDTYGEKGVVDMLGLSGWYCLVSMMLNVDRYPLGQGVLPELKPLENPLPLVKMGFATPVPGATSPATAQSTVNGKTFTLRGDRFPPLTYEQMSPEQKTMTDHALAGRGPVGMFNIAVRDPEAGDLLFTMGDRVRFHMSVPDKLKEMTILLTGRYWGAQFEWLAHHPAAVQAGLGEDKVKAIAEGRRPVGMSADEEVVYNFITELFKTKRVSDENFAAVRNLVGERGIVDLLATAGFYQIVSMFMNADRMPLANATQKPELKYLSTPLP
jgi:molybdate transport system substrate-binding protein